MADKGKYDFTSTVYDKKAEALKAVEKNFYFSGAIMLLAGGALIKMSHMVIGVVCIVLAVLFAVAGYVIVRKEGLVVVDDDGNVSFSNSRKNK